MTPEEKRELLKRSMESEQLADDSDLSPEDKRKLLKKIMLEGEIPQDRDVSMIGSAARGALRGGSYGLADEAYGAIEAGRGVFRGEYTPDELSKNYRAGRQELRELQQDDLGQNPLSTAAGMVGGAFASPASKLSAPARFGKYGTSAVQGALAGYGESESDNPFVQAEDVAKGAVLGPLVQKGMEKLPGKERLAEILRKKAREKAVTASGAMTKQRRALQHSGMEDAQGEFLLRNKIITPFASLEDVAERSGAVRQTAGEKIGSIINQADELIGRAISPIKDRVKHMNPNSYDARLAKQYEGKVLSQFGYSFQNVSDRIGQIMERDAKIGPARAYHFPQLQKLQEVFSSFGPGSLREGLRNKTEQRRLLKSVDSLSEEYKQEVYDIISDELERSVSKLPELSQGVARLESALGVQQAQKALPPSGGMADESKAIVDKWRQANRDYAGSAVAEKTALDRLNQVKTNRDFGLTTSIAANAGLLAGGAGGAVAMGGINNFFRKYGSTLQAVGYDRLADILSKEAPNVAPKYVPALREALQRGGSQFILANYLIAKQDPEYATFLDRLMKGVGQ